MFDFVISWFMLIIVSMYFDFSHVPIESLSMLSSNNITFDFDISLFMLDMCNTIIRHSVLFIVYVK